MLTKLKALLKRVVRSDLVRRAGHTFWQAAAASLIATFAGAGLNLADLTDWSADRRIVVSAVVAGLGAVFSALKTAAVHRKATSG